MQKYSVNQHLISNLIAWVRSGEIAIPEIQRPFVWDATKVRDLMDSLPQHELDMYCEKYNGFGIFMLFLEELFAEISSGRIHIPTYH